MSDTDSRYADGETLLYIKNLEAENADNRSEIEHLKGSIEVLREERDEYRAALKEINDCPTWAVGTLIADRYSRVLAKYTHEDDIEQARRTT